MVPETAPAFNPGGHLGRVDLATLADAITTILERAGGTWRGGQLIFPCPAPDHKDEHPSASWKPADGVWLCRTHDCQAQHGGGSLALARLLGIDADAYRRADTSPKPLSAAPERRNGFDPAKGQAGKTETLAQLQRKPGATVYRYQDAAGADVGLVLRVDGADSKAIRQWKPAGGDRWQPGGIAGLWPLYRLPAILAADPAASVYLAEGEKCADALAGVGLIGTSCVMGAGKAKRSDLAPLEGRSVVILPDNDKPGTDHAADVAARLQGIAARIRVLPPFKGGSHYDVADWLAAGGIAADLERIAAEAPDWAPPGTDAPADAADGGADAAGDAATAKEPKETQAAVLVKIAKTAELFADPDGRAFAKIARNGRQETHAVRGTGFRRWLVWAYSNASGGRVPTATAIADALNVVEGCAAYDDGAQVLPVFVRYAEDDAGRIFIDLGCPNWRAVEIGPDGWRIVDTPPVRFRRAKAMARLPEPERGGSLDLLRSFVNLGAEDWPLFLGWLVCAMRPRGPYPVLVLGGEQGASKSTIMRVARRLVDPNTAPLRAEPKEARDLMIGANNAWCIALDNLDGIPAWLSNALCRLATGGGFAVRTNYADDEETIFEASRPVALNGIGDVATRPDLLDRSLMLAPPTIPEEKRQTEAAFWADFERVEGRIFGALLDALSVALRRLPTVKLDKLPRMADAAKWVEAAAPGLGLEPYAYTKSLDRNRDAAAALALEASPIGAALITFIEGRSTKAWEGTMGDLLPLLNSAAPQQDRPSGWPKGPTGLAKAVQRIAPALRDVGYTVAKQETRGDGGKRAWRIAKADASKKAGEEPSQVSQVSLDPPGSAPQAGSRGGWDTWDTSSPASSVASAPSSVAAALPAGEF